VIVIGFVKFFKGLIFATQNNENTQYTFLNNRKAIDSVKLLETD
jgi:hypothetical protein